VVSTTKTAQRRATGRPLRSPLAVVALLVLRYAQPVTKITSLTISDIITDDDQVLVRVQRGQGASRSPRTRPMAYSPGGGTLSSPRSIALNE